MPAEFGAMSREILHPSANAWNPKAAMIYGLLSQFENRRA